MEHNFCYLSTAHSAASSRLIAIRLQREAAGGDTFDAILSVDDAERLLVDLPGQVRIAKYRTSDRD